MNLVFWQGILSPHQAPFIRVLAARPNWNVTVVAERRMTPARAAMGWAVPDLGKARVIVPHRQAVALTVRQCDPSAIHVLEGIRGRSLIRAVLPVLRERSARVGIISESADSRGVKGYLRQLAYTWAGLTVGKDIDFILAMGTQGVSWYRKCWFPESRIYSFAYTTACECSSGVTMPAKSSSSFAVMYIGRCEEGKGVRTVLRALAALGPGTWTLTVIGDGPALQGWQRLARDLGVAAYCQWLGALPNGAAIERLRHADVLVLPSTGKEGWGAVVNEALMQGVPVLCSDRCGARDLLVEPWLGEVFEAGSVESLRTVLANWIDRGRRTAELTQRVKSWSRCIEGATMAGYVAKVLDHVYSGASRPLPPWLLNGTKDD